MQTFFTNMGRAFRHIIIGFIQILRVLIMDGARPIILWMWKGRGFIAKLLIVLVGLFALGCALVWFGHMLEGARQFQLQKTKQDNIDVVVIKTPKTPSFVVTSPKSNVNNRLKTVINGVEIRLPRPGSGERYVPHTGMYQTVSGVRFTTPPNIWIQEGSRRLWPFADLRKAYPKLSAEMLRVIPREEEKLVRYP